MEKSKSKIQFILNKTFSRCMTEIKSNWLVISAIMCNVSKSVVILVYLFFLFLLFRFPSMILLISIRCHH